jgi:hypothetical protein
MDRTQFLALLARLRGEGEPLNADELRSIVTYLTENAGNADAVTDEEIGEIETLVIGLADDDEVPLDALQAAVEVVEATRSAAAVRNEAAEAEATEREALRRRLAGETAEEGDGEGEGDAGTGDGDGEGDAEGGDADGGEGEGAGDGAGEGEGAGEEQQVPAGATAGGGPAPARRAPGQLRNRRPGGEHQAAQRPAHNRIIRDGGGEFADLNEVGGGGFFPSLTAGGAAMVARRESFLSTQRGVSEQVTLASIVAEYPEERILDPMNPALNQQRLNAVVAAGQNVGPDEYEAVVAAGGFCAPFQPYYGFQRLAEADRPFRAGLEQFNAGRGGIIFRTPPDFPDFAGAVAQWTDQNDTTPGSDGPVTKPCLVVPCSETEDAEVYAVTECLTFGNFMARTDPETVRNAVENTMAAFARKAEVLLINAMKAASTQVTAGDALGAFRDLVFHIGVAAMGYRSRHRMRRDAVLEVRLPAWVYDMAILDLTRSLPGDNVIAAGEDLFNRALARHSVRIAALYIDSPTTGVQQVAAPQNAGQLNDFPSAVQWQISAPGSFLLLDNGRLDLGVVRDSVLNSTNDYQTFAETFEGLAFLGLESLWVTSTVCPNGATAGTVDPSAFCNGDYVPT